MGWNVWGEWEGGGKGGEGVEEEGSYGSGAGILDPSSLQSSARFILVRTIRGVQVVHNKTKSSCSPSESLVRSTLEYVFIIRAFWGWGGGGGG